MRGIFRALLSPIWVCSYMANKIIRLATGLVNVLSGDRWPQSTPLAFPLAGFVLLSVQSDRASGFQISDQHHRVVLWYPTCISGMMFSSLYLLTHTVFKCRIATAGSFLPHFTSPNTSPTFLSVMICWADAALMNPTLHATKRLLPHDLSGRGSQQEACVCNGRL